MEIIGVMHVIAVIIFGTPRMQTQRRVHQKIASPPTGTRKGYDRLFNSSVI